MAKEKSRRAAAKPARKPRTDALRNRERILDVAREVFSRSGASASLDEIARQAQVGAGTLYRHFPTRADLLKAVYRTEMEKLAAAQRRFADTLPPLDALRAWLLLFVEAIAAKQLIAPALKELVDDPKQIFEASYQQIQQAVGTLVARAIQTGDLRPDTDPADLLRALVGVAHVADTTEWQQSARRLVDILIAGSRADR